MKDEINLKLCLEKTLNASALEHKKGIELIRKSLETLRNTNIDIAEYIVSLRSYWSNEGEGSIKREHRGTLKDAIKNAEVEFKAKNNRNDIQADYSVEILLGEISYIVPKKYYQEFQEKRCFD